MKLTRSAGKRARPNHDWFWFYFRLAEKVAQVPFTKSENRSEMNNKCNYTAMLPPRSIKLYMQMISFYLHGQSR